MNQVHAWQLEETKRKADNAERRLYELDSLRRDVDSLEHKNREVRAEVNGLRSTCESLLFRIEQLEGQLTEMADVVTR